MKLVKRQINIENVAEIIHETCAGELKGFTRKDQPSWFDLQSHEQNKIINMIQDFVYNSKMNIRDYHASYVKNRLADGYKYGTEFSSFYKCDPHLVPFDDLPVQYKLKLTLFETLVNFFRKEFDVVI